MAKPSKPSADAQNHPDTAFLKGKVVLITGGTGSFGKHFIKRLLGTGVAKIIVFSRDELKQSEMQASIPDPKNVMRYFIGDIRDKDRVFRAFHGVDFLVHAAALKQVPALEYNPYEAVLTNVVGAQNIIDAAIDQGVERAVALSTDKAVNPVNLYGATKLCMEKLFVAGNNYAGGTKTRFSAVRYGNVMGSRGSVIPYFLAQRRTGVLPITDERMTRFWLSLDQGVDTVLFALANMNGGEVFVPKIPSMRITDLAKVIGPKCKLKVNGIRPGEKLHEVLMTEDEADRALDTKDYYVIKSISPIRDGSAWNGAKPVADRFRYASDTNTQWLTPQQLRDMVKTFA
jgi:UDP-N-acetylglucosamine 4,6-dehydratase